MYMLLETAPQAILLPFHSEDEVYRFKGSLTERDFARLSKIAPGAGIQGHASCYLSLYREANIWGSIRPLCPRLECVIGFLSGCGFTANHWE